ncbi:MAG TPA: DNA-3-methyladenine glycosylase [Bdellovibrionota bacterium]|jgi:DNA-3-methyladenine glycosylase|nr:DNA-3-methyladenine glycosylase [Bdellovibrionota bacterium]
MAKDRSLRLPPEWFARDATVVAPDLVGKILTIRRGPRRIERFVISETEAYTADDPASHAFRGKTLRNRSMFERAGSLYVYFIYGMYHCLNLVTGRGDGQAVLIRALIPLDKTRAVKDFSGPGKLCRALDIDKTYDGKNIFGPRATLWVEASPLPKTLKLKSSTRIGISKATEKLWRWELDHSHLI